MLSLAEFRLPLNSEICSKNDDSSCGVVGDFIIMQTAVSELTVITQPYDTESCVCA